MFAISAQHLSFIHEEKRGHYVRLAREHQDIGIQKFRLATSDITKDNCDALFAYSSLLILFTLATHTQDEDQNLMWVDSETDPDVSAWIRLMFGLRSILEQAGRWIADGPMRIVITPGTHPSMSALPAEVLTQFSNLQRFCDNTVDGEDAKILYQEMIDLLKDTYARYYAGPVQPGSLAGIFVWPAGSSKGFSALLSLKRPEALAVFAHYCVLLHRVGDLWWARGLSRNWISKIERSLQEPWKFWVRWPMEQMEILDIESARLKAARDESASSDTAT
jgi:hypothetical protein